MAKNKININYANKAGDTVLMCAARNNHLEVVQALLATDKIDVNFANKDGDTALDLAANKGHYQIVKILIGLGANFNMKRNWFTKELFMELSPPELLKIGGMNSKYYNNEIIRKELCKKWNILPENDESQLVTVENDTLIKDKKSDVNFIKEIKSSVINLPLLITKVATDNSNKQEQNNELINIVNINNVNEQLILQKMAACPNVPTNDLINEKQKLPLKKRMMAV